MGKRKVVRHNIYGRNKKIVLVSKIGNPFADDLKEQMEKDYFKQVKAIENLNEFSTCHRLGTMQPDFIIVLDEMQDGEYCRIRSCDVKDSADLHHMNLSESRKAKEYFIDPFMLLGLEPRLSSTYNFDYDNVKRVDWLFRNDKPFINIVAPNTPEVRKAVSAAVKAYFIDKHEKDYNNMVEKDKKGCQCGLYGSVDRR